MIRAFNEWLAVRASGLMATMACFWLVQAVVLLPLIWPGSLAVVQFVSSAWFQAAALPLLAVGTALGLRGQDERRDLQDKRREQDHAALMELVQALHDKHDAAHPPGSD